MRTACRYRQRPHSRIRSRSAGGNENRTPHPEPLLSDMTMAREPTRHSSRSVRMFMHQKQHVGLHDAVGWQAHRRAAWPTGATWPKGPAAPNPLGWLDSAVMTERYLEVLWFFVSGRPRSGGACARFSCPLSYLALQLDDGDDVCCDWNARDDACTA